MLTHTHRYEAATQGQPERLVSGSDDFTLFLWTPTVSTKPVARMPGHVQTVNQVCVQEAQHDCVCMTHYALEPIARMTGHVQTVNQDGNHVQDGSHRAVLGI